MSKVVNMEKVIIRFKSIDIENFKNIKKSRIILEESFNTYGKTGKVIGIYGQNGSGKTAVIEAFKLYKSVVSGIMNCNEFYYCINDKSDFAKISYNIYLERERERFDIVYDLKIKKDPHNNMCDLYEEIIEIHSLHIDNLNLKIKVSYNNLKFTKNTCKVTINKADVTNELMSRDDLLSAFVTCKKDNESVLFDGSFINSIKESFFKGKIDLANILGALNIHSKIYMHIYDIRDSSNLFATDSLILKFNFEIRKSIGTKGTKSGILKLDLFGVNTVEMSQLNDIKLIIKQCDIVMNKLIHGFKLDIKTFNQHYLSNGQLGVDFQLVSILEDGSIIPLCNESAGIKKIISLSSALITLYNKPQTFLAIDELDSGIFEYLLGELVGIINDGGRGQLLFTSHNLRLLEVLPKQSIVFSTTNPNKRFIHLKNVKTNNNLRDFYLRAIMYGGQKEELYRGTDDFELREALRRAGKVFDE